MSATTPSPKVSTRTFSWLDQCARVWGKEWNKPDRGYQFSNGRTFENTDRTRSGVYGVLIVNCILLEQQVTPPDMGEDCILQENGFALSQDYL